MFGLWLAATENCSFIRLSMYCPLFCVLVVCELWLLLLTKDKADVTVGHPAARLQVWRNRLTKRFTCISTGARFAKYYLWGSELMSCPCIRQGHAFLGK